MKTARLILPVAVLTLLPPVGGAEAPAAQAPTHQAALDDFLDRRFGMFIHWGPVSLRGTEIGWSRGRQVPLAEYDQLYKSFNPVQFNADEWARIAREAGMKYLVITAKHHDGFALWPTEQRPWLSADQQRPRPYSIAQTPFQRDVCGELAAACRKQDIAFGTYYSIADWYHFDWLPRHHDPRPTDGADMDRYVPYMKAQLEEILERYDPFLIWFDGEWFNTWNEQRGTDLYRFLRDKKDHLLINNRVGKGRHGMKSGKWNPDKHSGDFDTPEQNIGAYNDLPWETCMTICRQWAWKPDDKMKSLEQCIRTLVHCAGGNGNLLFNVGPMPDGRIEPRQAERLREMGRWLAKNGESIYGTRGGPVKPGPGFVTTRRDKTVYLHALDPAAKQIVLPKLPRRIVKADILGGTAIKVHETDTTWLVDLPSDQRQPIDTIVRLTLDRSVMDLDAVDAPPQPKHENSNSSIPQLFQ